MTNWHIFVEPALVAIGGIWGIWYLSRPKKDPLDGTLRERLMEAAVSKSYKPMQREEKRYMKEWKGDFKRD